MDTIFILWKRQLRRYVRSRSRVIGSLGQPLLFLLSLGFGFGPIFERAGGGNYIQFLTPGVIAMGVIFTAFFSGLEVLWDRQFGFLKETLVAPVSRFHIMIGRTLGGATVATIQGLIVLMLSSLVGFRPGWESIPLAFLFMFLIALLFTALGTAIASGMHDMQGFQLVMNFLVMPTFFLSGALFPIEDIPKTLSFLVRIDPLSYGVDGLRYAFGGVSHFGVWTDLGTLSVLVAICLAIGAWRFSRIEI